MTPREKEYKEIFIAEALEILDSLSADLVALEKNPEDERPLPEVFRLLHNLKANSKAIGYEQIADLAHKLENVFGAIRNRELKLSGAVVTMLLDGIDLLGTMLQNVENEAFKPAPAFLENLDGLLGKAGQEQEDIHVRRYYTSQNIALSELIYIPIRKLDDLMNLVGELIIDRDRIMAIAKETDNDALKTISSHLYRITNDVQNRVMDARLVNIGALFNKFPRIVRDIALVEDKKIDIDISGQDIKIDRNILQMITDSLLHLVRNAVSHGIEDPEKRKKTKKPATGNVWLSAHSEKDKVIIEVADDGKGIDVEEVRKHALALGFLSSEKASQTDAEIFSFLFEPGFSLAGKVTELSGRGVGLDVVKNSLDSIGGKIRVESQKGVGTTFSLILPTSIAVKGALLFEVDQSSYAIPLIHTDSVVTLSEGELHAVGASLFTDIKNETMPVVRLRDLFRDEGETEKNTARPMRTAQRDIQQMIVVNYNNRKLGLIVDKLLRQQDIVVKPLQKPMDQVDMFGGVTLLGTGEVCLVMDVPALARKLLGKRQ